MTLVTRKVIFVNQEIVICVQLPKSTVQYVEVLVGKVLSDHVDVVFVAHLQESF